MGDRVGRVHVKQGDLGTLEIRKYQRYVGKGLYELEKEKRKQKREPMDISTMDNPEGTGEEAAPRKKIKEE